MTSQNPTIPKSSWYGVYKFMQLVKSAVLDSAGFAVKPATTPSGHRGGGGARTSIRQALPSSSRTTSGPNCRRHGKDRSTFAGPRHWSEG